MFGVGWSEILLIMVVAVIVLGPKRLPEAMKQVARIFREVKSTVDEVKTSVLSEVDDIKSIPETTKKEFEEKLTFSEKPKSKDENVKSYTPQREKITFSKKVEDERPEEKSNS